MEGGHVVAEGTPEDMASRIMLTPQVAT
jgi:hypothetical protein